MLLNEAQAFSFIILFISLASILQTIELLMLKQFFQPRGVWDWNLISKDFEFLPKPLCLFFGFLLGYPNFVYLLWVRLLASVVAIFFIHPALLFILAISTLLISLRWRGTFNGGSDYMTWLIWFSTFIASCCMFIPGIKTACIWYIALQSCASYFIAGVAKLKKVSWRRGLALYSFLNSPTTSKNKMASFIKASPALCFVFSWAILIFEISAPVIFLNHTVAMGFISLAVLFHLMNFAIFGLNRFLFAWAATYPALLYCSQYNF